MFVDKACRAVLRRLAIVVFTGAAGCVTDNVTATETAVSAITNGAVDPGDPAVVQIEGGFSPCSGALITERAVLTAAHCLDWPPSTVFFGTHSANAGERYGVIAHVAHPGYDAIRIENDVALLLLDGPASVEPLVRLTPSSKDASPLQIGTQVRVVGFGRTTAGDPSQGVKRTGTARINAVNDVDVLFTADPSLPCLGDSGGPVMMDNQIVGIVSSGDANCTDHARAVRVDAYADSFLTPQLAAWTAPQARGGGCALGSKTASARWTVMMMVSWLGIWTARRRITRISHPNITARSRSKHSTARCEAPAATRSRDRPRS